MSATSPPPPSEVNEASPLLAKTTEPNVRHVLLGLILVATSSLAFSTMSLFVKLVGFNFPPMEIVFIRSILQFGLAIISCWYMGVFPWGEPSLRKGLVVRGFAGSVGLALFYYSLTKLPLSDATVLFFVSPIFTAILARLFLKESYSLFDQAASVVSFTGVIFVAQPEFLFGARKSNPSDIDSTSRIIACVACVCGSVASSIAFVTIRQLGLGVHYMVHVVYFGGISSIFSLIVSLIFEPVKIPSTLYDWVGLSVISVSAFVGQGLLNYGLQLAPSGPATLMRNFDIVFAFIFGITIFKEIPAMNSLLGTGLILCSTIGMGIKKWAGRR
ncbi:hypothetical protein K493DRAFT_229058 [Basidiobolus meristosporus CBS 931.73]|uniref:EamA domain-containing protein n=1 Tax=Basidiobolus meristosporus CBS 931.73 TaxID=1314790 RepID=A0A1Y1XZF3_9FUNG|nr:hypothetical protein K493DRAFT_229058 [Basidiobolus meristosporus CBS 931.73]|eukprot:ORX91035.1 hypothetical protein K493DRAFT_229058 [Basidiobolus meristosporus CBS 931.73]